MVPHLVEFHEKYGSKGLVILAVSQEPKATLEKFAKDNKITYRVGIDDHNDAAQAYPGNGVPRSWLIGADGNVLWSGHPGSLPPNALEDALKNVENLRDVTKALQPAKDDYQKKKYGDAWAKAQKVLSDAKAADADKTDAQYIADQVKARGEAALAGIDKAMEGKQYGVAERKLKEVQTQFKGTDWEKTAKDKQKALESNADAKKELEAQRVLDSIVAQEKAAKKPKDKKALVPTYEAFEKKYDGTEAAKAAQERVNALNQLPDK